MKIKSLVITATLLAATFYPPLAHANQKPIVESFTFTPTEVDILSANTQVDIELIVSHPSGIEDISTVATLTSSKNDSLSTYLTRIDSPVNSALTKVTFRGSLTVPRNIATGVYNFSVAPVRNNSSVGYKFSTDAIEFEKIRSLAGAESGLLVRSSGDLNLIHDTFVGPSHNITSGIAFNNPTVYNNNNPPIWKVGETYIPNKYFELRVSSLSLVLTTSTPTICSTDGKELKFIAVGNCEFKVSTLKTKDYALKEVTQIATITAARSKPELIIGQVANQTSKNLPKNIEIFRVYSPSGTWILPKATTPSVCVAAGFFVQIVGGGTCILTYQSEETTTYLASDLYKVSFEVVRDPQTISFTPPATANLSTKSLALTATASSAGAITFETTSAGICSITGATLNLLKSGNCSITATQAGTSTLAPISATSTVMIAGSLAPVKKSITCVMGKKSKKVSGANPKCPKGYKLKK